MQGVLAKGGSPANIGRRCIDLGESGREGIHGQRTAGRTLPPHDDRAARLVVIDRIGPIVGQAQWLGQGAAIERVRGPGGDGYAQARRWHRAPQAELQGTSGAG